MNCGTLLKILFINAAMFSLMKSSETTKKHSVLDIYMNFLSGTNYSSIGNSEEKYNITVKEFGLWLKEFYAKPSAIAPRRNLCDNDVSTKLNESEVICNLSKKCLGAEELLVLSDEPSVISSQSLRDICPLILYQAQTGICGDISSKDGVITISKLHNKPTPAETWGYGILFVTIISLCSVVGIVLIPLLARAAYEQILTYLVGLAVGSLASSSIFHLIPQSFGLLQYGDHGYLWNGLVIFGGIYLFFLTERILKIIMVHRKRKQASNKINNYEKNGACGPLTPSSVSSMQNSIQCTNLKDETEISFIGNANRRQNSSAKDRPRSYCHHEHDVMFQEGEPNSVATVAYMIIFGDGLHNFIDGLSIGAAFSENIFAGISISVAIICEEFPHELGDLAVLLNAGMSVRQALLYNFMSACTCYIGLVIGILLGELAEASIYIFAIAAGMFLYISLVDMLPEMNATAEKAINESTVQGIKILVIQSLGIFTGVFALFILAFYSEQIDFKS